MLWSSFYRSPFFLPLGKVEKIVKKMSFAQRKRGLSLPAPTPQERGNLLPLPLKRGVAPPNYHPHPDSLPDTHTRTRNFFHAAPFCKTSRERESCSKIRAKTQFHRLNLHRKPANGDAEAVPQLCKSANTPRICTKLASCAKILQRAAAELCSQSDLEPALKGEKIDR